MRTSFFIFILGVVVFQLPALALTSTEEGVTSPETHALMTAEEQEIGVRAKKRLYPGGKDEESLRVQAQLPTVIRRMAPSTEMSLEEPETEETVED